MLDLLRRGAKSWVAKLLIALLVISFAVWGIGDIFQTSGRTAVATVGDEEVTVDEYANALSARQTQLSRQAGRLVSFADMRAYGIDRSVLAGLVRDAAMRAETREIGLSAPDMAVAERIRKESAFQGPGGEFSDQAYRLFLSQQRMTPVEFETLIRSMIAQDLVTGAVSGAEVMAPGYAARIAAWENETRSVRLLTLPLETAEDPGVPEDATLDAYYEAEGERFREPERRYGRYLVVDVEELAAAAAPDDKTLRARYEDEKHRFVTKPTRTVDQITFPSLADAEAARSRITAGEATFETVAEEHGQTGEGLSLGTVSRGDLPEASDSAVFAIDAVGEIAAVETPFGGALLRVTALTAGGATPFEAVRDQLAREVAREQAAARAPDIANEIEELRAAGKTFEEIAEETEATFGRIEGLGTDGTLADGSQADGLLAESEVARELTDALEAEERDFVELPDGGYFVAMVERITPSEIPPLETVRDDVVEAWQREERLKALETRADRIAEGIKRGTGATLATFAAGIGRQAAETGFFTRNTPPEEVPAPLVEEIFRAETGGVVTARLPEGGGVVLAEVAAVEPMAPDALAGLTEQLEQALVQSLQADRREYLVRAVEAHHEAQVIPQAVEEVFARLGAGGAN